MSVNGDIKKVAEGREHQQGWLPRRIANELKDLTSFGLWRAVFAEFLGTLMLCLWTIGVGLHSKDTEAPSLLSGAIAAGFFIAVIISALLTVSGGHVNPAISIGFLLTGQITFVRFIVYSLAQCAGSVVAVLILKTATPPEIQGTLGLLQPAANVQPLQAAVFEFCIAFLLVFGTISMVDEKRTDIVGPVPLFVGLIVITNILFAGNISGGCMNPARNFGPAIMTGNVELQWVYWLGPMLGGAVGTLVYDRILSVRATTEFSLCKCGTPRDKPANGLTKAESVRMLDDMA